MTEQNVTQNLRLINYRIKHLMYKFILYYSNNYRFKRVQTRFERSLSLEICNCSREINIFFILLVSNLIISFDEQK